MTWAFLCLLIVLDITDQDKDTKTMRGISKGCCYDKMHREDTLRKKKKRKSVNSEKNNLMDSFRTYVWHVYQSVSCCYDKISSKTNLKTE